MKVLIVYLNEDERLQKCLDSLKKYSPNVEVVLKKADKTKNKVAEELYQEYFNSEEFTEDVIIFHPDMEATEGWFEKLMSHEYFFDVVGCKILYPNGLVNHYGGAILHNGVGYHPHQFSFNIGLEHPVSTAFVTGPGMVVKKKVWDKIKSYDFQFMNYIDVDFCFQAREKGFRVGVVPVELIHSEGEEGFKTRPMEETQKMLQEYGEKFIAKWMHVLK